MRKQYTPLAPVAILRQDSVKERLAAMGYDTAAGRLQQAEIAAKHKADVEKMDERIARSQHPRQLRALRERV